MEFLQFFILGILIFMIFFFGTVSGGIGLILRPLYILFGFSPFVAIGSANIAGLINGSVSIWQFHRHKKIDWRLAGFLVVAAFVGGLVGSQLIVHFISEELLEKIIAVLVLLIGILLLFQKSIGTKEKEVVISRGRKAWGFFLIMMASAVHAIVPAGVLHNSVALIVFKKTYITAAALRKVITSVTAIGVAITFFLQGLFSWPLVITISIAASLGTYFGIAYGIKKGEHFARVITLIIIFAMSIKLLFF